MKITIIGAGIGGLTTAISLRRFMPGIEVEIYESSEDLKSVGAGLGLAANAVMAFEELGIKTQVLKKSKILERFKILDKRGRPITQTNNFALNKAHNIISNFSILRADLQQVLLDELKGVSIHLNKRVKRFTSRSSGTLMEFTDSSMLETDYVIATDGIHSVFRKQLVPQAAIRFAGYTCWRGVTGNVPSAVDMSVASETWAGGKRFGIVPLIDSRVYWFACINSEVMKNKTLESYTKADLLKSFGGFHEPVPALIEQTGDQEIIMNDIIDFKPINQFAFGNILLLGDAAHATTPNMGQGACQAIEDAVILGKTLQKINTPEAAFRVFEQKRIKRTSFIVNRSWQIGKIAQLQNPVLAKLRDFAFRLIPERANEKQIEQIIDVDFG